MYNEKGILWKSILEIQGIPLIVIPYRYGVLTVKQGVEYFNTVEISSKRNNLTAEDFRNEAV